MKRDILQEAVDRRHTRRFVTAGYRVAFSASKTGHWHGGPIQHKNAKCHECRKPLRLIWSINLADKRLSDELRLAFAGITNLPFYYCFNCPQATTYQVSSNEKIKVLDPAGHDGGDDTPYRYVEGFPLELPRKSLSLSRIPSVIEGLMNLDVSFDGLDEDAKRTMSLYLGKKLTGEWSWVLSQFGGAPSMAQGDWDITCPNNKCPGRKYEENPNFKMKKLAYVDYDAIAGFEWPRAPLAFHICWVCGTIQGNFRCG